MRGVIVKRKGVINRQVSIKELLRRFQPRSRVKNKLQIPTDCYMDRKIYTVKMQ